MSGEVDRQGGEPDGDAGVLDFVGGWRAGVEARVVEFVGHHEGREGEVVGVKRTGGWVTWGVGGLAPMPRLVEQSPEVPGLPGLIGKEQDYREQGKGDEVADHGPARREVRMSSGQGYIRTPPTGWRMGDE